MASQAAMIMRIDWTPAMERYFIDLMLDQVHKGNRWGHTFKRQAWMDMLTMFNEKFGTKYDVDILKSHFSLLWKQYNDVKELLNQNGFSWDDNQKMVVADAPAWDAYIKAHPDAQSYRNKALINFNDLRSIYSYTRADGRFSLSSHDVDVDDDAPGVNADISHNYVSQQGAKSTKSSIPLASGERSKPDWRPSMDRFFIKILLDQLRKSNKRNKTFSKQAWKNMLTLFNEKFRTQYDRSFLRHRYKKLFKYYVDVKSLLEQKGFSWDEQQQMVVADGSIWEKYIKMHPDARSYRKKSLPSYHDLGLIFESLSTNGFQSHIHRHKNFEDDMFEVRAGDGKEVYTSGRSDDLLTYWTPAMDSYLTDLLLDQALRGNKIGQEFISQAWIEIITIFNAKFGCLYPVHVLKSRYKHLRKLYNNLSILLEQSGFFWDDTREMVTAADCVWDSFIKAYPNAQSYRNKSMPSYHKLSLIYGEESDDGRNSHLAHNKYLDNGGPSLMIGGVQFHANGDFPGTDWTPSMDRHFIDLLLEQVHKRHRSDYTFKNDAWINMALSFMERFGFYYDEDLLRSRYESLSKQYNDMKNLVGQRGFSWDEKRQMVAASDNSWNACIKEQPDVKKYRTEPKPNYNDLCLIFGNPTSDRGGSQFVQDISCNGGAKLNNGYHLRTDWTPPMDRYFIDLMLEQVRHGSMVNKKFNKEAWIRMIAKFGENFGSQYDKDILKSRFMNLRSRFNEMKNLLNQNGFFWDEMRQMIIADGDLWDAYVKKHPDARSYWNKTLPNYNDLFLIYGDANTEGTHNYSSYSIGLDAENYAQGVGFGGGDGQSPASNDSCMEEMADVDNIFGDLVSPAREFEIPVRGRKRKSAWSTSAYSRKKVERLNKDEMREAYNEKTLASGEQKKEYSSIEIVVDALQAIPGMDDELFLEACKLLEDENKVKRFVAMDVSRRRTWLLKRLRR